MGTYCIDNLSPFWLFNRHSSGLNRVSISSSPAETVSAVVMMASVVVKMAESFIFGLGKEVGTMSVRGGAC